MRPGSRFPAATALRPNSCSVLRVPGVFRSNYICDSLFCLAIYSTKSSIDRFLVCNEGKISFYTLLLGLVLDNTKRYRLHLQLRRLAVLLIVLSKKVIIGKLNVEQKIKLIANRNLHKVDVTPSP